MVTTRRIKTRQILEIYERRIERFLECLNLEGRKEELKIT